MDLSEIEWDEIEAKAKPIFQKKERALTNRQLDVLELAATGYKNKEIAAKLKISKKTVEKHRQKILERTGINGLSNLVHYALAKGIVKNKYENLTDD